MWQKAWGDASGGVKTTADAGGTWRTAARHGARRGRRGRVLVDRLLRHAFPEPAVGDARVGGRGPPDHERKGRRASACTVVAHGGGVWQPASQIFVAASEWMGPTDSVELDAGSVQGVLE